MVQPEHEPDYADALTQGRVRGRGAGVNPGTVFEDVRLHVLGETLERQRIEAPEGVQVGTEVYEDHAKTVLNRIDSPDLPMRWTMNPYRGCEHGCVYCYARRRTRRWGCRAGWILSEKSS